MTDSILTSVVAIANLLALLLIYRKLRRLERFIADRFTTRHRF